MDFNYVIYLPQTDALYRNCHTHVMNDTSRLSLVAVLIDASCRYIHYYINKNITIRYSYDYAYVLREANFHIVKSVQKYS